MKKFRAAATERHLYWTADTRLTIMSQAPEPQTWAMLAAGLLLVGWAAAPPTLSLRACTPA